MTTHLHPSQDEGCMFFFQTLRAALTEGRGLLPPAP